MVETRGTLGGAQEQLGGYSQKSEGGGGMRERQAAAAVTCATSDLASLVSK